MKIARWGWPVLIVTLAVTAGALLGRSQQASQDTTQPAPKTDSLAEAARRARAQQKSQPKPTHVWNNDNLPTQAGVSVVGTADTSVATAPAETPQAPVQSAQDTAQLQSALNQAKEKVAALAQDVDIAQRKLTLDSDMYYGKTDYQEDKTGKAALDSEMAAINDKKKQLAEAQAILASLQGKLGPSKDQKQPPSGPKQN